MRAEPDHPEKSALPDFGTMCPNHESGSDSSPPCRMVTAPRRPSSILPSTLSVARYDRDPSSVPAAMKSVVAFPTIPDVNVLENFSTCTQSPPRSLRGMGSAASTWKRAMSAMQSPFFAWTTLATGRRWSLPAPIVAQWNLVPEPVSDRSTLRRSSDAPRHRTVTLSLLDVRTTRGRRLHLHGRARPGTAEPVRRCPTTHSVGPASAGCGSVPRRARTVDVEHFEDPVGVLPNGSDVAKHPLRWSVIRHLLELFLPVDVLHPRPQALDNHAQSDEQRSNREHLLHGPIVFRPGRAEQRRRSRSSPSRPGSPHDRSQALFRARCNTLRRRPSRRCGLVAAAIGISRGEVGVRVAIVAPIGTRQSISPSRTGPLLDWLDS